MLWSPAPLTSHWTPRARPGVVTCCKGRPPLWRRTAIWHCPTPTPGLSPWLGGFHRHHCPPSTPAVTPGRSIFVIGPNPLCIPHPPSLLLLITPRIWSVLSTSLDKAATPLCIHPVTTPLISSRLACSSRPLASRTNPPSTEDLRRATTVTARPPGSAAPRPAGPSQRTAFWASEGSRSAGTAPQRGLRAGGIRLTTRGRAAAGTADVGAPTWNSARTRGRARRRRWAGDLGGLLEGLATGTP